MVKLLDEVLQFLVGQADRAHNFGILADDSC